MTTSIESLEVTDNLLANNRNNVVGYDTMKALEILYFRIILLLWQYSATSVLACRKDLL